MRVDGQLRERLLGYLQEARAMEEGCLTLLDGILVALPEGDALAAPLERHRAETEDHRRRLGERLHELGSAATPDAKRAWAAAAAPLGGDGQRIDETATAARRAFAAMQIEIGLYDVVERLAERVSDSETAALARRHRADEERIAATIAAHWGEAVDGTVSADGAD